MVHPGLNVAGNHLKRCVQKHRINRSETVLKQFRKRSKHSPKPPKPFLKHVKTHFRNLSENFPKLFPKTCSLASVLQASVLQPNIYANHITIADVFSVARFRCTPKKVCKISYLESSPSSTITTQNNPSTHVHFLMSKQKRNRLMRKPGPI